MEGGHTPAQGLCGLKLEGFVAVVRRLLERLVPEPDETGGRICIAAPFRIEERGEHLRVWTGEKLVLEQVAGQLQLSQLTSKDLFEVSRLEARLNRQKQP